MPSPLSTTLAYGQVTTDRLRPRSSNEKDNVQRGLVEGRHLLAFRATGRRCPQKGHPRLLAQGLRTRVDQKLRHLERPDRRGGGGKVQREPPPRPSALPPPPEDSGSERGTRPPRTSCARRPHATAGAPRSSLFPAPMDIIWAKTRSCRGTRSWRPRRAAGGTRRCSLRAGPWGNSSVRNWIYSNDAEFSRAACGGSDPSFDLARRAGCHSPVTNRATSTGE
jgi:hypothetical protein